MAWPACEPRTSRPESQRVRPNHYATKTSNSYKDNVHYAQLCFSIAGVLTTGVLRDCKKNIPVEITDSCIHGTFDYVYRGLPLTITGTICPCFASLCNVGNITLGGAAGTGTPPSTTHQNEFVSSSYGSSTQKSPHQQQQPKNWSTTPQASHLTFDVAVFSAIIILSY